jgi:hypothetical protein
MNLPHSKISKAAEIIMQHHHYNKLPGNAEVYYTIRCLLENFKNLDKQDKLLVHKLQEAGIEI